MTWLIIIGGLATLLTVLSPFAKKPRASKALSAMAALLIISVTGWSACREYETERPQQGLMRHTYQRLFRTARGLMELVREAAVESSDGWVPEKEEDLCSERVAGLLCWNLRLDAPAPVLPKRPWLDWMDQKGREAEQEFDAALSDYGEHLGTRLIVPITGLKNSQLVQSPRGWILIRDLDRQGGYQRPPLLCPLPELQTKFEEELKHLCALYQELLTVTSGNPIAMPAEHEIMKSRLGQARMSEEDLRRWAAEHPYAPSGQPPDPQFEGRFVPVEPRNR